MVILYVPNLIVVQCDLLGRQIGSLVAGGTGCAPMSTLNGLIVVKRNVTIEYRVNVPKSIVRAALGTARFLLVA